MTTAAKRPWGAVPVGDQWIELTRDWKWTSDDPDLVEFADRMVSLTGIPDSVGHPAVWALKRLASRMGSKDPVILIGE